MNFSSTIIASLLLVFYIANAQQQPLIQFALAPAPAPSIETDITKDPAFQAMNALCNGSIPLRSNLTQITGPIKYSKLDNGANIAYVSFGNATSSETPLVYISGFGDTMKTAPYDLLLELSKEREVVVFDLPGQGLSTTDAANTRLTIPSMANDTAAFIQSLNFTKPADVLGFSMGGFIAMNLLYPPLNETVNNVILASSGAGGRNASQLAPAAIARLLNATKTQYEVMNDSYTFTDPRQRQAACSRYGTYLSFYDDPENKTTTSRQFRAINERDSGLGDWGIASTTQKPVWLVVGSEDEMVQPEDSHSLAAIIEQVWLTVKPNQRHSAFATDPAWFVDVYNAFSETFNE